MAKSSEKDIDPVSMVDAVEDSLMKSSQEMLQFDMHAQLPSFPDFLALAQANLVQQTQSDIMRMFSIDLHNVPENKIVTSENESPEETETVVHVPYRVTSEPKEKVQGEVQCEQRTELPEVTNSRAHVPPEKSYTCSIAGCGRTFSWSGHLKYHQKTHQQAKQFKCSNDGCDKCFLTMQQLNVHQRSHTGHRPFKCEQCAKSFTTAGNLKNHIRIHTGDKPFECPDCQQKFAEYSSLKKHSLVHTGEKPFSCPVCDKTFTQSGSMSFHLKKHAIAKSNDKEKKSKRRKRKEKEQTSQLPSYTQPCVNLIIFHTIPPPVSDTKLKPVDDHGSFLQSKDPSSLMIGPYDSVDLPETFMSGDDISLETETISAIPVSDNEVLLSDVTSQNCEEYG